MTGSAETARLDAAYRYCRRLNARHGKTFYLATGLLPAAKRPPIHALYGFARFADDIVDHPLPDRNTSERLSDLRAEVERAFAGGQVRHPVVHALAHTVRRYDIDTGYVTDFLDAMASDLTVTRYPTFADLDRYMWGSASVIGLQLLPILGVKGDYEQAMSHASQLGVAFQLTNFIRDIGEDYRRGRIYLPQQSLAEHGVRPAMLAEQHSCLELKAMVADEIGRARGFYRRAEPGIALLERDSRDCVRTAFTLYGDILTEIEHRGYEVLSARAVIGPLRRFRVGMTGYVRAFRARRG
ncbi:MAG TPA: phytoene/squalene synthase family protein [Jatrophihabitans sp.]